MFGKSDEDKKKEEEKKKMEDEQKKLENIAEDGEKKKADEAKPDAEKKDEEKKDVGAGEELKKLGEATTEVSPEKKEEDKKDEEKKEGKPAEPSEEKLTTLEDHLTSSEPSNATAEKKPAKKDLSEIDKLKKQLETQKESMRELEKEKGDAMKKGEELAGLVEDLSTEMKAASAAPAAAAQPAQQPSPQMPDLEPRLKEIEEKTASQIKEIQEAIEAMGAKKDEEKKDEEEVAVTMKKMFDKRLKELSEKLEESKAKPAPGTEGAAAGAKGAAAGGLEAIGGGVDLKNDMDGFKKSLKDMATLFDAFKEEAENRFMALDRELEVLDRFPDMEQKMEQFEKKLGPENVDKLRMLISNADDLKEEVIPLVVKRETEEKMDPFAKRVKNLEEQTDKAMKKFEELLLELKNDRKDIKSLYKYDDRIAKTEESIAALKKGLIDTNTLLKDLNKSLEKGLVEKIKELFPKMLEAESSSLRKEFAGKFAFFEEALKSAEVSSAESSKEIAELSALKGEMGEAEDKIDTLKEMDEKLAGRIEDLRGKDQELLDKIEDLQTPDEVITELDNKTKDILEIREFFVRRANDLEERIKEIDERAVPTRKLHEKVDSLFSNLADIRQNQQKLEQKFDAEKNELQKIIAQHAAEKKALEEKLTVQKERISTLLREFK